MKGEVKHEVKQEVRIELKHEAKVKVKHEVKQEASCSNFLCTAHCTMCTALYS